MTPEKINEAVALKLGWVHQLYWFPPGMAEADIESPPDYCHSIAAAWAIVESLADDHIFTLLAVSVEGKRCYKICFENDTYRGEPDEVFAEADTATMAICLAFLKLQGGLK